MDLFIVHMVIDTETDVDGASQVALMVKNLLPMQET